MSDLKTLGGQEMDWLVATKVLGWKETVSDDGEYRLLVWPDGAARTLAPAVSTVLDLTWIVIEALSERGWRLRLCDETGIPQHAGMWVAHFWKPLPFDPTVTEIPATDYKAGKTPSLAICRAALAVAALEGGGG